MLLTSLKQTARAEQLHPLFARLFDYVRTHNLAEVPAGRIEICGEDLFINVSNSVLVPAQAQKLEVHRRYIDVHIPLSQPEVVGWSHLSDIEVESEAPFNNDGDFALYDARPSTYFTVRPGQCLIVWPEDAHAPIIGEGKLRKLIAKVRL